MLHFRLSVPMLIRPLCTYKKRQGAFASDIILMVKLLILIS